MLYCGLFIVVYPVDFKVQLPAVWNTSNFTIPYCPPPTPVWCIYLAVSPERREFGQRASPKTKGMDEKQKTWLKLNIYIYMLRV